MKKKSHDRLIPELCKTMRALQTQLAGWRDNGVNKRLADRHCEIIDKVAEQMPVIARELADVAKSNERAIAKLEALETRTAKLATTDKVLAGVVGTAIAVFALLLTALGLWPGGSPTEPKTDKPIIKKDVSDVCVVKSCQTGF